MDTIQDDRAVRRDGRKTLPSEIWSHILESANLDRGDLISSCLVCHLFRDLAQPLIHDTLHINIRGTHNVEGFQTSTYYQRLEERFGACGRLNSKVERLVVGPVLRGLRRPAVLPSRFVPIPGNTYRRPASDVLDAVTRNFPAFERLREVFLVDLMLPTSFLFSIFRLPRLRHLHIECCRFEDGRDKFREYTLSAHPTLRSLHVEFSNSGSRYISTQSISALLPPLLTSPLLQELKLQFPVGSTDEYYDCLSPRFPMLHLKRLMVGSLLLQDGPAFEWFRTALSRYPSLQTLAFQDVSDPHEIFAEARPFKTHLIPNVSHLEISYFGLKIFAGMRLSHLHLMGDGVLRRTSLRNIALLVRTCFPDLVSLDMTLRRQAFVFQDLLCAFNGMPRLRRAKVTCGALVQPAMPSLSALNQDTSIGMACILSTVDGGNEMLGPPLEYLTLHTWPQGLGNINGAVLDDVSIDVGLVSDLTRRYPRLKSITWERHHSNPTKKATLRWLHPEYDPALDINSPETNLIDHSRFVPSWKWF